MKFDTDKIESLINKNEKSLAGFAKKIGMSHAGLRSAIDKSSLRVKYLIKISEYFNKPIQYFFTNDTNDIVEEKYSTYKNDPIPPTYKKCTNPDCLEEKKNLQEKIDFQNKIIDLQDEKIEMLEGEKGVSNTGKKVEGGVEKPARTGTNG